MKNDGQSLCGIIRSYDSVVSERVVKTYTRIKFDIIACHLLSVVLIYMSHGCHYQELKVCCNRKEVLSSRFRSGEPTDHCSASNYHLSTSKRWEVKVLIERLNRAIGQDFAIHPNRPATMARHLC